MRTKIVLYSLFLVVFYSCNPNDLSDVSGSYWYKSDLLQQGIKGKVKTISYNSGVNNSYNESGFLTLVTSDFDSISYEYNASGQLLKEVFKNKLNFPPTTITYEYNNHGKFIYRDIYFVSPINKLWPELSAETTNAFDYTLKVEFVFKDPSTMNIVRTYQSKTTNSPSTTSILTMHYSGGFPIGWTVEKQTTKDITYSPNGMFKSIAIEVNDVNYNGLDIYQYENMNEVSVLKSVKRTTTNKKDSNLNSSETSSFTYNDKNDIAEASSEGSISQYVDYVYDANNNWISRTYKYKFKGETDWTTQSPETRTIEYW